MQWSQGASTAVFAVPFDRAPDPPRQLADVFEPQLDARGRLVSARLRITDERCDRYQFNCQTLAVGLRATIEDRVLPDDPRYQDMPPRAGAFAAGPLDPPTFVFARRGGIEEIVLSGD